MIAKPLQPKIILNPSVSEPYSSDIKPERNGERKYPNKLNRMAAKDDPTCKKSQQIVPKFNHPYNDDDDDDAADDDKNDNRWILLMVF